MVIKILLVLFAVMVQAQALPVVQVDYFFNPGCEECARVEYEVLPLMEAAYADLYDLRRHDLSTEEVQLRLAGTMRRLERDTNARTFMLIGNRFLLAGFDEIELGFAEALDVCLQSLSDIALPTVAAPDGVMDGGYVMQERLRGFTPWGVLLAGLTDGINPCAISTLVFFISFLAVSKVRRSGILIVGGAFCLAVFATYFALGFGLFRALHLFWGFETFRYVLEWGIVLILLVLAFFSFRDAFLYRATHDANRVSLQLPRRVKERIHGVMRREFRTHSLAAAALITGILVTLLEAVCTGQVYVPTMVYVVKSGAAPATGLLYLLLYNAAFVLPLVIVFVLSYRGLRVQRLLDWSRANVIPSKLLLGVLFLIMAALVALM